VKQFNLFAYGTLMMPRVFRAVLGVDLTTDPARADGRTCLLAEEAVLDGYKKISPDRTYHYAVPDGQGRIRGLVVRNLPGESMKGLREYEGKNYRRRRLKVQTKDATVEAVVFIGNLEKLEHSFGYQFNDPLKQEILLGEKIDQALLEAEQTKLHTTEGTARRAVGELHGSLIRDLVRKHFDEGGISDYAIRSTLKETPLRDFHAILADPEARALAPNYLSMVIRQVVFNQFEERIRQDFRYELDHMGLSSHYYDRTISSLVALRVLNASENLMEMLVADCLTDLDLGRDHLIDYVRWAIIAADAVYDSDTIKEQLSFVATHMGQGWISLGAELEFSNIGHGVITDPKGSQMRDLRFDGFLYFSDFGLDILTWKLGGHVDDHYTKVSDRHKRGFFEVALGSLSIEANISKPITDDPWLLNQVIHQCRQFFQVAPHSVHISLQLKSQHRPEKDRMLPLAALKCLFAIGGGVSRTPDGHFQIGRLTRGEIVGRDPAPSLMFSEISKRYSREGPGYLPGADRAHKGLYVQQFRFLRLSPEMNFEPIALALKGLQISRKPGTFATAAQYNSSRRHRERLDALLAWGAKPSPLTKEEMEVFLASVYEGLMVERRGKPAHSEAYIAWAMAELREALAAFNRRLAGAPADSSVD
jgi:hypothetical protein